MTALDVAIWEFEELVARDPLAFDANGHAACGCRIADITLVSCLSHTANPEGTQ